MNTKWNFNVKQEKEQREYCAGKNRIFYLQRCLEARRSLKDKED